MSPADRRCAKIPQTFAGFGFGAIQAGLFLYEASRIQPDVRLVVAEINAELVAAVRAAGGCYGLNIAHPNHIAATRIGPLEVYNPFQPGDRSALIAAVADASAIATAVPSVDVYVSEDPGNPASLHQILAAGLAVKIRNGGPRAVLYTAENHPQAAMRLRAAVSNALPADLRPQLEDRVAFVDTVIGKMCGVAEQTGELPVLQRTTPDIERAFLVEAGPHTITEPVAFATLFDGIFKTKPDLAPFAAAKLYGHNAAHALAAYLAGYMGLRYLADLVHQPALLAVVREALLQESGPGLIHRYGRVDPLFTSSGWAAYVADLLPRMFNPYLRDSVARVGRDPLRKLAWDDRLVGAMRLALAADMVPWRYATGMAAALSALGAARPPQNELVRMWREQGADTAEIELTLDLVRQGEQRLPS